MQRNARLSNRGSVDEGQWMNTSQLVHGNVLGEGMLEAYRRVVDARLGLEEEADAPFVPVP